ncbi:MAG TPA: iron-containing redox enzyme family protein [Holophagaceae bacterium]|nr:iron-containing redox enzyme family protein [Holophagaceae bacterium]
MTKNSQRIHDRVMLFGAEKRDASKVLWEHPEFPAIYPSLMMALHTTIRASVPLMAAAVAACEARPDDAVAQGFAAYLREHIPEERDHEEWVVEDLGLLGVPRERVLEQIPGPHAAALVGAQYYWIHHAHPIALMGYLATLEWEAPAPEVFGPLAERSGIPFAAFRTFHSHALLDIHHRADMEAMVDGLPLTETQHSLIGLSILSASQGIAALYAGLVASHEARGTRVGA